MVVMDVDEGLLDQFLSIIIFIINVSLSEEEQIIGENSRNILLKS